MRATALHDDGNGHARVERSAADAAAGCKSGGGAHCLEHSLRQRVQVRGGEQGERAVAWGRCLC